MNDMDFVFRRDAFARELAELSASLDNLNMDYPTQEDVDALLDIRDRANHAAFQLRDFYFQVATRRGRPMPDEASYD